MRAEAAAAIDHALCACEFVGLLGAAERIRYAVCRGDAEQLTRLLERAIWEAHGAWDVVFTLDLMDLARALRTTRELVSDALALVRAEALEVRRAAS